MKQADWMKFKPEGICTCDEPDYGRLSDDMTGEVFYICLKCSYEVMPCKHCGKVPCQCVELNNDIDTAMEQDAGL